MEIPSLLLLIPDLPLDEPAHMPELIENRVTVDHDLSGGVISPLYPGNGDTVKGTAPASTKENPYKTTCEEVDNKEVYSEKLPSTIPLEMTLKDTLKPPLPNNEMLRTFIADHFSSREETKETKPEVVVPEWPSQSDETSSFPKEEYLDRDEPTLWEWETDYQESIITDEETSEEEEEYSSEDELVNPDSTYTMSPAAQETKWRMENALPNIIRRSLGLPDIPETKPAVKSPTTETTGLRDAIQALLRKEKLGGHQKKRLRLMNEELARREN